VSDIDVHSFPQIWSFPNLFTAVPQYWDFTCWATCYSRETEFLTYIQNGNRRGKAKNLDIHGCTLLGLFKFSHLLQIHFQPFNSFKLSDLALCYTGNYIPQNKISKVLDLVSSYKRSWDIIVTVVSRMAEEMGCRSWTWQEIFLQTDSAANPASHLSSGYHRLFSQILILCILLCVNE
jgi:hypothetical protein